MDVLVDIEELIGNLSLERSADLLERIQEPAFAIKDMHVLHQYVHHWRREKLLWSETRGRSGAQYSFLDYVWLKMVERLRDFGLPFTRIREVKTTLQQVVPFEEWLQMLKAHQGSGELESLPQSFKDALNEMLSNEEAQSDIAAHWQLNYFMLIFVGSLVKKFHLALLINLEGQVMPFTGLNPSVYFNHEVGRDMLSKSYLSLSVSEIVKEIINEQDLDFLMERVEVINEDEREVIDLIRSRKLSELNITFDNDQQISLIKATETSAVDVEKRFLDMISRNGYQEITFTTERGKVVRFKNTTKIKPHRSGK